MSSLIDPSEYFSPISQLFSLSYLRNKKRACGISGRGLSRLAETGTRGTLLSITALIGSYVILCYGTTYASHSFVRSFEPTFVSSSRIARSSTRFLISRAIIRYTWARERHDFYLYFGVTGRRHIKEINRGMRPPRPRRIFTRLEEMGMDDALVKHFLIKSKSIAPADACLCSVAERAVKRTCGGTGGERVRAFRDLLFLADDSIFA